MGGNTDQSSYITPLVRLWGSDKNVIAYRPEVARLTGSATSALLLQQIYFRWEGKNFAAFYKFKETCTHKLYQVGDSWCEELAFGRTEFDTALKKIGTKVRGGKSKQAAFKWELPRHEDFPDDEPAYQAALAISISHVVIYWTDGDHKTWYELNSRLLHQILTLAYDAKAENPLQVDCEESAKSGNQLYLDEVENPLHLLTETSTKNTNTLEPAVPDVSTPKRKPDPIFDWVSESIFKVNPDSAHEDKDIGGWIGSNSAKLVNAEKKLLGIPKTKPLTDDCRRALAAQLPGILKYWQYENPGAPTPPQNKPSFAKLVIQWYAAGKPFSAPIQEIRYVAVEHDEYISPNEALA